MNLQISIFCEVASADGKEHHQEEIKSQIIDEKRKFDAEGIIAFAKKECEKKNLHFNKMVRIVIKEPLERIETKERIQVHLDSFFPENDKKPGADASKISKMPKP